MPAPPNYDPDDETLPGMSLRQFIEETGMSYSAFSRELPASIPYARMVAKGDAWPSYNMAKRIERVTNGCVPRTRWYPAEDASTTDV